MPRGGHRPGSGRPKGTGAAHVVGQLPREVALDPREYLLGVMRDETADPARRDRCAAWLLPYVHHRVADQPPPGKREMAEAAGKDAARGTVWEDLLK
jgi:hypothetical protein